MSGENGVKSAMRTAASSDFGACVFGAIYGAPFLWLLEPTEITALRTASAVAAMIRSGECVSM